MKYKYSIVLLIFVVFLGCTQNSPVAPSLEPDDGQIYFSLSNAENIVSGKVTISKGTLTYILPININNYTGNVVFKNIQVGLWTIKVGLYDAQGTEIYSGDSTAMVYKNLTTNVDIKVNMHEGNISIVIEVPHTTYKIIYAKGGTNTEGLWLMEFDGAQIISDNQVIAMTYASEPDTYPGSNSIVFSRWAYDLWKVDLDGSNLQMIFDSTSNGSCWLNPKWKWTGDKLLFLDNSSTTQSLYTMNPDGTHVEEITANIIGTPSWHCWTQSNEIVYVIGKSIYIQNIDGSNQREIWTSTKSFKMTDISITGKILFYMQETDGTYIGSIQDDGSSLEYPIGQGAHAHFTVDGSKIIFDSTRDGNNELYIMDANGKNQTRITNTPNLNEICPVFEK